MINSKITSEDGTKLFESDLPTIDYEDPIAQNIEELKTILLGLASDSYWIIHQLPKISSLNHKDDRADFFEFTLPEINNRMLLIVSALGSATTSLRFIEM